MEAAEVIGGRYRLVEQLADGGMSVVWRAYDEVLGRLVAVKVLAARYASDATSRQQLRIEALAVAKVSHPHVGGVYDYGESQAPDGTRIPYLVMELLHGRSLAERLEGGPLPWRAGLVVGAEIASALAAAHACGLVHRDVKPGNVMLTTAGAKVVDFGIATLAGHHAAVGPDGVFMGTPAYLAPERLTAAAALPASDVYAFGVLLYRLLTGFLPWRVDTVEEMLSAHQHTEPNPLPAIDGMPPAVDELIQRCLAKSPEDRPSSDEVSLSLASVAGIRAAPSAVDVGPELEGATEELPTRALSWPAGPVGDASATGWAARVRRARVVQAIAGTGVVAAAALLLAMCIGPTGGGPAGVDPAGSGGLARAGGLATACNVRYHVRTDTGSTFRVDILIRNTTERRADGWTLAFTFPGDQTVVTGSESVWSQAGQLVTGHGTDSTAALSAGGTTAVGLEGRYQKANPLPTRFTLNDEACAYTVIGAAGQSYSGGPPSVPPDAAGRSPTGATTGSPTLPASPSTTATVGSPVPTKPHKSKPPK